ncbi:DUF4928 family protein [Adhaeribacter soli]|uniref:DUF4928 domain-containing protein n=1 Tax=Adhaeribacter soli TaxID=2607655 RepID=A0A5N1J4S7_9BACT|nr:DUF4928 family protein [Adhaeribacter soli]KAA9345727.1 DUF4928 domain-containing protein [Adhaeribacter soli]
MKELLEEFYKNNNFNTKGPLSVAVQLTKAFKNLDFPLKAEDFLTERGGQVKGLGGPNLKKILKEQGIERILASEGARTSRGSIENMRAYIAFLNAAHESGNKINWEEIEAFWVEKVQNYFDAAPFSLNLDASQSIKSIIQNLTTQAIERQRQVVGVKYLGIMLQHLVGAKLELIKGDETVIHNCSSNNDQDAGRTGDFDIGEVSIHVTTRPTENLMLKCRENLNANRKPLIVTLESGVLIAEGIAEDLNIKDRIDIIDFYQFIVSNIHERSWFDRNSRQAHIEKLIENYNSIIDKYETDPSLKIEIASGK